VHRAGPPAGNGPAPRADRAERTPGEGFCACKGSGWRQSRMQCGATSHPGHIGGRPPLGGIGQRGAEARDGDAGREGDPQGGSCEAETRRASSSGTPGLGPGQKCSALNSYRVPPFLHHADSARDGPAFGRALWRVCPRRRRLQQAGADGTRSAHHSRSITGRSGVRSIDIGSRICVVHPRLKTGRLNDGNSSRHSPTFG
jgi:hypothetical protein